MATPPSVAHQKGGAPCRLEAMVAAGASRLQRPTAKEPRIPGALSHFGRMSRRRRGSRRKATKEVRDAERRRRRRRVARECQYGVGSGSPAPSRCLARKGVRELLAKPSEARRDPLDGQESLRLVGGLSRFVVASGESGDFL